MNGMNGMIGSYWIWGEDERDLQDFFDLGRHAAAGVDWSNAELVRSNLQNAR